MALVKSVESMEKFLLAGLTVRQKVNIVDYQHIYVPVGCPKCLTVGYAGRQALFELLTVNDALRDVILKTPTMTAIREALKRTVFTTLAEMGWQMVAKGRTSPAEIDRIVGGG